MRNVTWILAATVIITLATSTVAWAGGPYRGGRSAYRPNSGMHYGAYHNRGYGSYRTPSRKGYSFTESSRQIRAYHSRYRYTTHPRSLYKAPPHRYDYWGWQ